MRGDGTMTMRADVIFFADETVQTPLVVVRENQGVQLAWWIDTREGPTQVETMGQRTLRVHGWADRPALKLYFRHDTALVDDHVFEKKGATIDEVTRREDDRLHVRQRTTLTEPRSVDGSVACRLLRWGWVPGAGAMSASGTPRVVPERRLSLHRSATGDHVLDVSFAVEPHVYEGAVVGEWAEVSFEADLVFKGWVKKSSLAPAPPGHGRLGSGHRTRAPRIRMKPTLTRIATVAADTPLFVGKGSDLREAGVVEKGADVRLGSANARLVAFTFDHGYVNAPDGLEFFLDPKALEDLREEDRGGSWKPPELPVMNEEAE